MNFKEIFDIKKPITNKGNSYIGSPILWEIELLREKLHNTIYAKNGKYNLL